MPKEKSPVLKLLFSRYTRVNGGRSEGHASFWITGNTRCLSTIKYGQSAARVNAKSLFVNTFLMLFVNGETIVLAGFVCQLDTS